MFTATLVYTIRIGFQNAAAYVARVQGIDLFELPPPAHGLLELLGMDLVSDITAQTAPNAVSRRIILQTNAQGDLMHPTADAVKAATRNLFQDAIGMRIPARVVAAEPVVA